MFDVVEVFGQFDLTVFDVVDFFFEEFAGVVMVFVVPLDFFLELFDVDFDVAFDFGVSVIEHVLEFGAFVLEVEDNQRILGQFFVYLQDFGIDFLQRRLYSRRHLLLF